ncbi:sensor histidine kinase [Polaribacter ponticola]|uniref:Sensor histidine kinase n=1 Tax=Polaribacter ponticola TaxID=2978475 RepID=A0ABT5S5E4_9FLAO|nr:sensor histidine kinase [Polaribacter sp. MSW5]MDD7913332.1 sensor histidine kinase [Polaribacter sp. MSW5]
MAKIPFKVSARAGKLLGRENFSNPEGAIIELVKNSYDADANNCFVFFDVPFETKKNKNGKEYQVPIKEKSVLYIIDNGEGMTQKVINEHWMQIGTGNKEKDFISEDKRTKTGAKGIGRFALDRLGFETEMWTLPKKTQKNQGAYWKMDWNQFDDSDKVISQIEADIEPISLNLSEKIKSIIKGNTRLEEQIKNVSFNKGTILKINNLKDSWDEDSINDVFKNLEALIPPKELKIPFEVYFHHFQNPDEFGEVNTAFFNDYDYKLAANYNAGKLKVDFEITRNEFDIKLIKEKYAFIFKNKKEPYDLKTLENKTFKDSKPIGEILKWEFSDSEKKQLVNIGSFDLTFYYLKQSNSSKSDYPYPLNTISSSERKSVLSKFGGVKIYRDSFRVRPYGDPTNDWLKLGARRATSPAGVGQRIGDWRVGSESTAGIITISRKTNPLLIDKSDRGSLQENDSFDLFKKIIIGVIHQFEFDRTKIFNPFYKHFKQEKEAEKEAEIQRRAEKLASEIIEKRKEVDEKVYGKKKGTVDLFQKEQEKEEKKTYEQAFKDTFKAIDEEKAQRENKEIVQVRALASLGLIVSSFAHELKQIRNNSSEIISLEVIYKHLISEELKKGIEYKDGIDIINLLKENNEKIKHWVNYSLTSIQKDKRNRGALNFSSYFKSLERNWKKVFKSKDIKLELVDNLKEEKYSFRAFEMDISTIFSNLINNSIDSFESLKKVQNREIKIESSIKKETLEFIYSDNGAGIPKVFTTKEDIFLAFTTSKKNRKGDEIGTGLGMYLVKSVIDDNNGDIDILETDKGFKVKIVFPIRKK